MDAATLKSVRDNAMEVQDYMVGLRQWEKDIKKEDERLLALKPEKQSTNEEKAAPPIRSQISNANTANENKNLLNEVPATTAAKTTTGKKKIGAYDYDAWDKYDVDDALKHVDKSASKRSSAERETEQHNNKNNKQLKRSTNNSSATKTSPSPAGVASKPTEDDKKEAVKIKDEGNSLYSNGQYEEAVKKYTAGLRLDSSYHILYANRAIAYIKLNKGSLAEQDCTRCLELSPHYLKALLRRGAARHMIGVLHDALADYKKVLEVEPWNKDAKQQILELQKKLGTSKPDSSNGNTDATSKNSVNDRAAASIPLQDKQQETLDNQTMKVQELNKDTKQRNKQCKVTELSSAENTKRMNEGTGTGRDINKESKGHLSTEEQPLDPDIILPVNKPLHLRSRKPLRKIAVVDVINEAAIPPLAVQQRLSLPVTEEPPSRITGDEKHKLAKLNSSTGIETPPSTEQQQPITSLASLTISSDQATPSDGSVQLCSLSTTSDLVSTQQSTTVSSSSSDQSAPTSSTTHSVSISPSQSTPSDESSHLSSSKETSDRVSTKQSSEVTSSSDQSAQSSISNAVSKNLSVAAGPARQESGCSQAKQPSMPPVPRTSHQFMSSWAKLSTIASGDAAASYQLVGRWLQSIKASTICKFELEVECMTSMVTVFLSWTEEGFEPVTAEIGSEKITNQDIATVVQTYLEYVASSKSFELNVLFMTSDDKSDLLQLLGRLQKQLGSLSPKLVHAKELL